MTIPNVHLQRGSTMVAYSGGKQLRGPQCSGLLLGRKDLVKAAWIHSAPHHGFARSMKVGKEEIVGALVAVEAWVKRDHKAAWQRMLDRGEPRILVGSSRGALNGVSITAFNLASGDERIVANRLHQVLSSPRASTTAESPKPPAADLTGVWDVHIEFAAGSGEHSVSLHQQNGQLQGVHHGEFVARDLSGTIDGDTVQFRSSLPERAIGNALSFTFTGKVAGDRMSGDLDMGEYLTARWSAKRHRSA